MYEKTQTYNLRYIFPGALANHKSNWKSKKKKKSNFIFIFFDLKFSDNRLLKVC